MSFVSFSVSFRFYFLFLTCVSSFGYWKKDGDDSKTFMEDKLIQLKAESTGSPRADLGALNDLESEIKGHRSSLDRLIASGDEMVEQGHFAGGEIKALCFSLVLCS